MRPFARLAVWGLAVVAALPAAAGAEIVHLSTGRTLSVQSHTLEGEWATLVLRAGGEITFPASLIVKVEPDEVAPLEPAPGALVVRAVARALAVAQPATTGPYAAMIRSAARRYDVDPRLVHAVIRAESNFRPRARSGRGARGLMQLMPATAARYGWKSGREDLSEPALNIRIGAAYLRDLLKMFPEDPLLALAAYNAGEGAVQRHGRRIPPYRETQNYVRSVMATYDALKKSQIAAR